MGIQDQNKVSYVAKGKSRQGRAECSRKVGIWLLSRYNEQRWGVSCLYFYIYWSKVIILGIEVGLRK